MSEIHTPTTSHLQNLVLEYGRARVQQAMCRPGSIEWVSYQAQAERVFYELTEHFQQVLDLEQ